MCNIVYCLPGHQHWYAGWKSMNYHNWLEIVNYEDIYKHIISTSAVRDISWFSAHLFRFCRELVWHPRRKRGKIIWFSRISDYDSNTVDLLDGYLLSKPNWCLGMITENRLKFFVECLLKEPVEMKIYLKKKQTIFSFWI